LNTAIRRSPSSRVDVHHVPAIAGTLEKAPCTAEAAQAAPRQTVGQKIRVYVAAENRLVREALRRMLGKQGSIEVVGLYSTTPFDGDALRESSADVVLLFSRGNDEEELSWIQQIRESSPSMRILVIGATKDAGEFLRGVRAGVSGYLLPDASGDEVLNGIQAVQAGEAVCPGSLLTVLFRYFEREAFGLPCASVRQQLGLTRRELQLIPLIAKGFTNKEIANHFCLSEQTVKNHLYRMKHKMGAEDRLSIVQRYRTQSFLF
jgi:DNA-binding NarL/FixJ family response regulator